MNVLIVLISHDTLGGSARKTGFCLEELAAPYHVFKDAGAEVTLASPLGGRPSLDPRSDTPEYQTDDIRRFRSDASAEASLASTVELSGVSADDYDVVFFARGHGTMWDLAEEPASIALVETIFAADKADGRRLPWFGRLPPRQGAGRHAARSR